MANNQYLNWGKSLKLPKMQFREKKIYLFDFTCFFCLDFFKFSGPLWRALCNLEIVLPGGLDGKVFVQRPF